MPQRPLYQLTPEDAQILERGKTDARWVTSYYVRSEDQASGWAFDDHIEPPWQLRMHHSPQMINVIIGGMGSAKSSATAMSILVYATLLPDFKGLVVAPTANQAYQQWQYITSNISGSLYEKRFIARNWVEKPFPRIFIDYLDVRGRKHSSMIEFMSASDDAVRIKNYEGDMIVLDQAEMMEDLFGSFSYLGTRLRGKIKGRHRMGKMIVVANADDSPDLWRLFDMGTEEPNRVLSLLVTTYSNKNLTPEQIHNFELLLGNDPKRIDQHLNARRPSGGGLEFRRELLEEKVYDEGLDRAMEDGLERFYPGYTFQKSREADVVLWELPRDHTRTYAVVGDPGVGAAPRRNAPVAMVFDVTNFPFSPTTLRAFWWGNGLGKYDAFVNQIRYYNLMYHAEAIAYDATAGQKIFADMVFQDMNHIFPIDLGGAKKKICLATLKVAMNKGLLRLPQNIKGLNTQLLRYTLPDEKLDQDLVSVLIVLAGFFRHIGIDDTEIVQPADAAKTMPVSSDRTARLAGNRDGHAFTRETVYRS